MPAIAILFAGVARSYIGNYFKSAWYQQRQLRSIEITPFALGQSQIIELQLTDLRTLQRDTVVVGGSQHALDLMVFSLLQHDLDPVGIDYAASHCRQRRGLVVQLDTGQQSHDQFRRDRIMRGSNIDLGHVMFG